jgi:hypothetical protein
MVLRDAPTESTERTEAAVTSDTPLHQLLRALVRFWWVAIVGIVLAVVVFTFATYHVSAGFPPKLESRAQSTYSASTQVLITSKREPYLSATNVNAKIINLPTSDTGGTGTTGTGSTPTQSSTYDSGSGADGDLARLVEIANDLPPRVTSDPVIALRNRLYRRVNGSVTAVNPYAFSGAGGFRSGPLPYIKITGTANSKQDALDITNSTALAFKRWFEGRQAAARIKSADRVVVEQVNSADNAFPQGGSKPLLGIAAALLVLLGVAGLALALDRLIPHTIKPRRSAAGERPEPAPQRTSAAEAPRATAAPKPAESRPVEANPFEPRPFERKPVEVRPAETQRAAVAPPEDEPAHDESVEAAPVAATPPLAALPHESDLFAETPVEDAPAELTPLAETSIEAEPVEAPATRLGATVDDVTNGDRAANGSGDAAANGDKPASVNKPTSRQRKGTAGSSSATRRRRTTASSPKHPPNTDDPT